MSRSRNRFFAVLGLKTVALASLVAAMGGGIYYTQQQAQTNTSGLSSYTSSALGTISSNDAQDLANVNSRDPVKVALVLEKHLKPGTPSNWLNNYDFTDPIIKLAVPFWKTCGNICSWFMPWGEKDVGGKVQSCNPQQDSSCGQGLQCAAFVYTVFQLAHHPLPKNGNAIDYWNEAPYNTGMGGWKEIPDGKGLPSPGDLMVWSDPPFGHIAIVVGVQAGTVYFVHGNGPTYWKVNGFPVYKLSLSSNNVLAPLDGAHKFLGYIHNTNAVSG
jgi:hypothetical protein